MDYRVYLVKEAEFDLLDIYQYVHDSDCVASADKLIDSLEETCHALQAFPQRGQIPIELERIGVFQFRQIHYKPYRIIYEIIGHDVFVLCVFDGRRDLTDILQRRLIRPG